MLMDNPFFNKKIHIKFAPFFFKIRDDINIDDSKKKRIKINEFIFATHFGCFGSNVLILVLKTMNFEAVF
jgi:hypothetical protein